MAKPDVIIIGGGIIGAACARELSRGDLDVTLVDAGNIEGQATSASAGMLAPLAEARVEDPLLNLNVRARDSYVELAPELEEETGIEIGHWTGGIIQVAFTEDEVDEARNTVAWQRQAGFTADWLSADDIRERCPGISEEILGGVLAAEDGALEPMKLHEALLRSAEVAGATLSQDTRATTLLTEDSRVTGIETPDGAIESGNVVIAAGCWSGRLGGLPRPLSVEPVRGQMASVDWPEEEPRSVIYGPRGYVLKRGSEALIGATMEHVGFDASTTEEGIDEIMDNAIQIYPALSVQRIQRQWAGLRPGTPDGCPVIGRDPEVSGLWYATGHGRNGILLAALTGTLVRQMFLGEEVDLDLKPIDPGRFWTD